MADDKIAISRTNERIGLALAAKIKKSLRKPKAPKPKKT
jgi:hypothetical protein